jgi:membrane protease subunit HflK
MPDNNSPWGNKGGGGKKPGQNPWGSQGKPDRNRPRPGEGSPDLDNVIQGFKKLRAGGGGGPRRGGGNPNSPLQKFGPLGIAAIIGLLLLAASMVYTVDQQEEGVVLRFGKYQRTVAPGLNFKLPTPFETVEKRKTRVVQKTTIGGNSNTSLMLTGDDNIVDIDFTVLWRINDLKDYIFEVDQPAVALKAVGESAMREIVGRSELENIITTERLNTTIAVRDLMQSTLDEYGAGIEVVEVQLQKADAPDGKVVDAFRDVVDATQEKETSINEATAYQNTVVPKARGEAAQILQDAEAYKGRVVAEAKGEAERFNLILGEYQAAPRVTRQRMYLETIEEVYKDADKILLDSDAGSGVVPYLPLDQLGKRKGAN